jgi:hypothetical protein
MMAVDTAALTSNIPGIFSMASMPELGAQAPVAAGATIRSLRLRQTATVLLLFGGYGALYFCRADLSVATPLLADELGKHGLSHGDAIIRMGSIASFGVFAYALGKLFLEVLGISGAAGSTFSSAWWARPGSR